MFITQKSEGGTDVILGKVEAVKLVEHVGDKLDLCKITIDFDEVYIWGEYNELIQFVGEPVEYSVRRDVIKGEPVTVIANIANKFTVQTLDKKEGIKLIPKSNIGRAECTFDVSTLKFGDTAYNQTVLLSGYTIGKSDKTQWIDCSVIDKYSKVFTLRVFTKSIEGDIDAEAAIASFVGYYVKSDITLTKYGYQTKGVELVNVPVVKAPEVDLAITALTQVVESDAELNKYCTAYNMLSVLAGTFRVELGYELVYMAAEIALINELENMSDNYDFRAMRRAVFTSRGYLLPCKTRFSKSVLNFTKVAKTELREDRELLLMTDPLAMEDVSQTKTMFYKLREMAKYIIDDRRRFEAPVSELDKVRVVYGGDVL